MSSEPRFLGAARLAFASYVSNEHISIRIKSWVGSLNPQPALFIGSGPTRFEQVTSGMNSVPDPLKRLRAPSGYPLGRILFYRKGGNPQPSTGLVHREHPDSLSASYIRNEHRTVSAQKGSVPRRGTLWVGFCFIAKAGILNPQPALFIGNKAYFSVVEGDPLLTRLNALPK